MGSLINLKEHWREGISSVEFAPDSEKSFEVRAKVDLTREWLSGICSLSQGCSLHHSIQSPSCSENLDTPLL